MASLPQIKVDDQAIMLMQSRWKSQLDPMLKNILIDGNFIQNIRLSSGDNIINHRLGRQQLGWFLVDQNAGVTIYRSQPLSDTTLTLNSSGTVTVSLWCF